MRAKGNGLKEVCVQNLLAIIRGEVVYDRLRGLDMRMIDRPGGNAANEMMQDAKWDIKTYEPRAIVENIRVVQTDAGHGDFKVTADIR